MVTTDDYSYKPGLAAAPAAAAAPAPPPSFHHPLPLQLHGDGGGDHDKVLLLRPPPLPDHASAPHHSTAHTLHLFLPQHAPVRGTF